MSFLVVLLAWATVDVPMGLSDFRLNGFKVILLLRPPTRTISGKMKKIFFRKLLNKVNVKVKKYILDSSRHVAHQIGA